MKWGIKIAIIFLLALASCSTPSKLFYNDDWEGSYTLVEYNCCGDTATKVKLNIVRTAVDNYSWRLFFDDATADTIIGNASYNKNKLKFFVDNTEVANRYFVKNVSTGSPVFWMEYHNKFSHYTWWYNDLRDYRRSDKLFAGIDYHFRKKDQIR